MGTLVSYSKTSSELNKFEIRISTPREKFIMPNVSKVLLVGLLSHVMGTCIDHDHPEYNECVQHCETASSMCSSKCNDDTACINQCEDEEKTCIGQK